MKSKGLTSWSDRQLIHKSIGGKGQRTFFLKGLSFPSLFALLSQENKLSTVLYSV